MALHTVFGLGLLLVAVALAAREMTKDTRPRCRHCGSPYCHCDTCIKRAEWDAREASALAKLDAALREPSDDLAPWRAYLESL